MATAQQQKRLPKGHFLFTSESVTSGHPDKLCDYVSDSVLDACLKQDPRSRVACESSCKNNLVSVFGEITTRADFSYETVVRDAIREIGYDSIDKGLDYRTCMILIAIDRQSPDIAQGIEQNLKDKENIQEDLSIGAGDQGLMIGYASDETKEMMPWTQLLANKLCERLQEVREKKILTWVRPDAKAQVTMEYKNDGSNVVPVRVHTVLISVQHDDAVTNEQIRTDVQEHVIKYIVPAQFLDNETLYYINPSSRFVIGGPAGDAGLTGRKIIVDTYGGWAGHGGGAFSGKDGTKVDRSGAYAARWVAKSLVAAGLARRCMVQISYGIGIAEPLSIYVHSYRTSKAGYTDDDLVNIVWKNFDLRPGAIIRDLRLREPRFKFLSAYGHFGREGFAWETPKVLNLGKDTKKASKAKGDDVDEETLAKFASLKVERLTKGQKIYPVQGKVNRLITSALPYANNLPHLGTLIGCVLSADVFARYCRLRGYNTLYICGTDEYGTATETQALKEKVTPEELCAKYFELHRKVYEWFDIDFDYFGRTSTKQQTEITHEIFHKLHNNGYTIQDTMEQLYCLTCTRFLADRLVEGICPFCGSEGAKGDQCDKCSKTYEATELKEPRCHVCRTRPEVRQTKHIFLDLPKISGELEEWIKTSSEEGHWSENSKSITAAFLKMGLKPRCITRDLKWGTPVPLEEYKDKVFYVWFDAPIGYLSITANIVPEWERWWKNPKDVKLYQFMGKDNVTFHTVIFPCSLIGTKDPYTLLHHVATTEFLNYEGGKFSKSQGLGVFGDHCMETGIPVEVWRYYLLINRPETSDTDFKWADFRLRLNSELLANVGNLCNRALKFAYTNFDKKVPEFDKGQLVQRDLDLLAHIHAQVHRYAELLEAVDIREGLKLANEISSACNKYVQDEAPWEKPKIESKRSNVIIGVVINVIRVVSLVYEPYMPSLSAKINNIIGLTERTPDDETLLARVLTFQNPIDFLSLIPAHHPLNRPIAIFREMTVEECEAFRVRYPAKQAK